VTFDLTEHWATVWSRVVAQGEERHGTPVDTWRTGGRKTKANPEGETLAWWQAEGLRQVEDYVAWMKGHDWKIATMPDGKPGIEWEAEVSFGGTPIKLIVDGIYEDSHGDWIIVDYKTGSRTPSGVMQLGLYASAIERALGRRPKWGSYYMTRKASLDDLVDLTNWSMDFYDMQFGAMNAYMATGFFPAAVGDHCGYCSYKDYCVAVNGPKALQYPMVNPLKEGK
jgi:hypothetical protein